MDFIEQGVTRRHTFFCVDRERHTRAPTNVVEVVPKQVVVFGREVQGWVVTTDLRARSTSRPSAYAVQKSERRSSLVGDDADATSGATKRSKAAGGESAGFASRGTLGTYHPVAE